MLKSIRQAWQQAVQAWPLTRRWGNAWGARTLALTVLLSVFLIIAAFMDWETRPPLATHARVMRGPFLVTLTESGDVESVNQQSINAPMMWGDKLQVIDLVDEGAQVKKGDFLVQFDAADLENRLDLALDNLETLRADLKKLDAQQALTISNMERQVQLNTYSYEQAKLSLESQQFESEAVKEESRIALKQAELDLATSKVQLANQKVIHRSARLETETRVRQAEENIDNIRERLDRMRLTAPIDGMIVYQVFRNERIKKGYEPHPGQPLMSIPDLGHMQIKLYVNEVDRLKVEKGLKAQITLDAYPELSFTGRITDVARLAQTIRTDEDLKGFAVYITVDGADTRLRPGMTAKVEIILEELDDVLSIPLAAVHETEGMAVVFPEGKTRPVEVALGKRNDGFAVVEEGLKEGQKLAWLDPVDRTSFYGSADEQVRIDELRSRLRQSFSVFEKRGILHDYLEGATATAAPAESETGQNPAVDVEKLPASIRARLQKNGEASSAIQVAEPGKVKEGTFRVSPEMMKRLNRQSAPDSSQKGQTPTHGE